MPKFVSKEVPAGLTRPSHSRRLLRTLPALRRSFVVARINPLRSIKGEPPALEEVLKTMRERAAKFNVEKIRPRDLAGAAGPPDEET